MRAFQRQNPFHLKRNKLPLRLLHPNIGQYQGYQRSLNILKMENLHDRREKLCLRFAKKCLKQERMSVMFPRNNNQSTVKIRNKESFHVNKANTERYKNSAIPFLQRKLNESINIEKKQLKALLQVNCVSLCWLYHFMKINLFYFYFYRSIVI